MAEPGTFDRLVAELGQALLPLREALASPEAFIAFLQKLGWRAEDIPQPLRDLGSGVEILYDGLTRLLGEGGLNVGGSVGDGEASVQISPDDVSRVLRAFQEVVNAIRAIATAPDSAIPATLRADGFKEKFPGQLIDHLVITYLQRYHPSIGFGLRALGVAKTGYAPPEGNRPPYMNIRLDLTDLPQTLSEPSLVLKNAFGWGEADFDFEALAVQVDNLMMAIGVDIATAEIPTASAAALQGTVPKLTDPPVRGIRAVFFERAQASGRMAAEMRLLPVPAAAGNPPGLALIPAFNGALDFKFQLGDDIAVTIRTDLDLQGGIGLQVRPGRPIEIIVGFAGGGSPSHADGSLVVKAERGNADAGPIVLLGSPGATRLQYRKLGGTGGIRMSDGAADVFAELELAGLEFVFDPGEADGFIAKIVPDGGFTFGADLTLGVSQRTGFYFRGTSGLEIQLPVHLNLGPIDIQSLTVSAAPGADGLPINLGATFKAELGPIKAVVEELGLAATFGFRSGNDGNLGPLDVSLGFKPPKGAGLSVDAGVVSGGGYLFFDPAKGEYGGALELDFAGLFDVKAIGLITTRMPDGSAGFSLLLIITAEFGSGIQLGFGFTLLAVGGIIGLNRRMNLQALVEGVQTGSIESVMFPRDVVANAPRILSDLRAFFPPEQGTFLVGPMAKIGWGTPTLVSVSLAVIIEIPGNIAILGVLRCALPTTDLPLLVLQVQFVGAIEFDKQRLWFFAQLFESRVLFMTLEGGLGLLVGWGDNPDLVISVGGFHPSYKPPPLPFPVPPRIRVDILNRPGARITVSGYFAITSNTVQFGARAEMVLGFDDFGISGHLSFDALFQFSPFRFVIAVSAGVSLKAFGVGLFGIDLAFQLEGPAPFRAHGRGSISLLFFEISADFDITWGEDRDTTLPPIDVLPLLAGEVAKPEGWQTRLPTGGGNPLVTLRTLAPTEELVLHPLGSLFIRQRAIPLAVRLDRIGAQRPRDGKRFTVEPLSGSGLVRASVTAEKFAMAQFQDMDDATKLSRPAYEDQDAGLELVAAQGAIASARVVKRSARYEQIVIDSRLRRQRGTVRPATRTIVQADGLVRQVAPTAAPTKTLTSVSPAVFTRLLEGSSTSRSPLSRREADQRQPYAPDETVQVKGQRFVVAYLRNNAQAFPPASLGSATASFRSQAAAEEALAEWVIADPALIGQLHVIPESEAAALPVTPQSWTSTGSLPTPAIAPAAVRLSSGRILAAGGQDAAGEPLAAAALFDPVAGTWAATAPLPVARDGHTLCLLPDGRVLAAGGVSQAAPLATTEIYDPLTATWSSDVPPMHTARHGHRATVLRDGKILVSGGTGARGNSLASAEVYDPAKRQWTQSAMTDPRCDHQAVLLADGRVLVVGGVLKTGRGTAALGYCEIYDPAAGTWTPTGSLATPRAGHQATLLADDTVLVTGGDAPAGVVRGPYNPGALASAERFTVGSGTWTAVRAMPGGRTRHRALPLRSGLVLVAGGTRAPAFDGGFCSALLYDPAADTWTFASGLTTGRWAFALIDLPDGRVLAAGGRTRSAAAAPHPGTDILTPTAEIFTP
ncbi:DUF6603 domain-containing protein [Streptomyces sp. YS415]|uniref:DUF6603 domain-containing protein n=1 Tax=Streptomyces sp. YS415 TaxID=2944806 RepID=UPI00202045B2|nr:DUF6603 domain-containing protein [Streptomyces sp. YS415]MCL7427054.1 hypothetical protein [Streptomyces sp. YS415]